jgi:hypothetical protein
MYLLSSCHISIADMIKALQPLQNLDNPPKSSRKRKREARSSSLQDRNSPPLKRHRSSLPSCKSNEEIRKEVENDISDIGNISNISADPVEIWVRTNEWPSLYFRQDNQAREAFECDSWLEEQMEEPQYTVQYVDVNGRKYPCPIRKLPTTLRRRQSNSSLTDSSNQKERESKSAQYRDIRYTTLLAAKGSYMCDFDEDIIPKSIKDIGQTLLAKDQVVPRDSLFRDDLFRKTCRKIEDRNEAMIIQDITRLIVPSAQNLALYGATNLDPLIEGVSESWTGSIPVEGPRPQPDYCVGFKRSAFTVEQLQKLDPIIGTVYDTSYFVATYRMYFPFLTCEVKCGTVGLDVADRQNSHSMTIAVRGIVELYKAVKREKELDREILAFSVSHDHCMVRIYGHYAVIEGSKYTFYRHTIKKFDFTSEEGRDKWTAYKFTKNVYDMWMPTHLKRICSVVDELPLGLDFEVSQESELQFNDATGLSQEFGGLLSQQSNVETVSRSSQSGSELVPIVSETVTEVTSVSGKRKRQNSKG